MYSQVNIRVLIVDDDEDDFYITSQNIKHIPDHHFIIDWCSDHEEVLAHMRQKKYDIYFVDYLLGARSGVDLLKDALNAGCEEPIILLTGKGNRKVDIESMQLGAIDYLVKTELTIEKMERSIRYALGRSAMIKTLKANERKFRGIFEKSKDIIFIADANLRFIDINDAATQMLGYTQSELLHKNLKELIDQTSVGIISDTLELENEINEWEVTITTGMGDKRTCIITAFKENSDPDQVYIQGIIHDITNLRKAEKATLQLEKLAAAGRLLRTLAHEVRNPLNNITLSVEQMLPDANDPATVQYLDIIQRNSRRIGNLITELLNTSRPSEITLQQQVLQTIIDDVILVAIDRLTLKQIKVEVQYPDHPIYISADKEKLQLALLNIVTNAIEAMEEVNGLLNISLNMVAGNAQLDITDNGCGISEENVSKLFEPFFTQKRNGVGLGLAFTLNILQSHKANIEVASTLGSGTTFKIIFPLLNI